MERLKESTLPLIHYYYWGERPPYKVSRPEKYDWITEYISDVRDYLKGNADILLIAGSREFKNLDMVLSEFLKHHKERKIIEIVSGLANGPDKLGIEVAKELHLPWAEFPADWDKHGKSAGMIRNSEMADYATRGLIFWDGKSKGTANMIDQLNRKNIPFKLINFLEMKEQA